MITAKLDTSIQINNFELLTPKLKELIDKTIGSNTQIILPISQLKIKGNEIKKKNYQYGLVYDSVGFIPFMFTIRSCELQVIIEDVKIKEENSYFYKFYLSDKGTCNLTITENYIPILECNLINAPVEQAKTLIMQLRASGKLVDVKTEKPSTFLKIILSSVLVGIAAVLIWSVIFYMGESTYEAVDKGGKVFFILIPLGYLYGLIVNTVWETIFFIGVPLLIFVFHLIGSLQTKKKSDKFMKEFLKSSQSF